MEKIHQYTKDFMNTAGQIVREKPSVPTVEEMDLRLSLEFEELFEKAEAMGRMGSFEKIVINSLSKKCVEIGLVTKEEQEEVARMLDEEEIPNVDITLLPDTNKVNLVEVFDAALDQRVVASGTDLAFGFQHIIEAGDAEVYRSNMSKFDDNDTDVELTTCKYNDELKVDVITDCINGRFVTKRADNLKVLKSHKYSPTNLVPIIENAEEIGKATLEKQEQMRRDGYSTCGSRIPTQFK